MCDARTRQLLHEQILHGTGLGLAIAKGIMEAHGGAISAQSPANGRGRSLHSNLPARGYARMSAKIRALIINDEAAILRVLKPALEANSHEMASSGTVAEGMKRIT